MPFGKTTPAARARRMLRDKRRVTSKRGLLPVVRGLNVRETLIDKVPGMRKDGSQSVGP